MNLLTDTVSVVIYEQQVFSTTKRTTTKIINAPYKVFSQTSYKKAPMSEIADECEISKALSCE